jgi:hypothetical protein
MENHVILCCWIKLDISGYSLNLIDQLIDLLELDQEDLVSYDALYQVNELFSLEDVWLFFFCMFSWIIWIIFW